MAPYRIPVFNELASFPDLDLSVVYLATSEPHRRWPTYENEMTYDFKVLQDRWRFKRRQSWSHLSKGMKGTLRSENPDVIVAGGWDQPSHLFAYWLRKKSGSRFIWWVESTGKDTRGWARAALVLLKKALVRGADAIVVPGSASRRYVRGLGAEDRKIFTAVNAVDNAYFENAAIRRSLPSDGATVFLTVARLSPEKGLEDLLQAWSRSRLQDARLRIVGDGPLGATLRDMASRARLTNVEFVGHVGRDALLDEYRSADVLVLPSHSEPWGLVVNEAMAAGLPVVVSSAVGSAEDLVAGRQTGIVFQAGDRSALAAAIQTAADWDVNEREGRRSEARALISNFTPDRCASGIHKAITSVMTR